MAGRVIRIKKLMEHTGLSRSTIYDRQDPKSPRHDSSFPRSFSLGGTAVGWYLEEVDQWIQSRASPGQQRANDAEQAYAAPGAKTRESSKSPTRRSTRQSPRNLAETEAESVDPPAQVRDAHQDTSSSESLTTGARVNSKAAGRIHREVSPTLGASSLIKPSPPVVAAWEGQSTRFISLTRVVESVARQIKMPEEQLDSYRGLNCRDQTDADPKPDEGKTDQYAEMLVRSQIANVLRRSTAAGMLLAQLNRVSMSELVWFDASFNGIPVTDDEARRKGMQMLAIWTASAPSPSWSPGHRISQADGAANEMRVGNLPLPGLHDQIGFDVDDLIRFLDERKVPHGLRMLSSSESTAAKRTMADCVLDPVAPPRTDDPIPWGLFAQAAATSLASEPGSDRGEPSSEPVPELRAESYLAIEREIAPLDEKIADPGSDPHEQEPSNGLPSDAAFTPTSQLERANSREAGDPPATPPPSLRQPTRLSPRSDAYQRAVSELRLKARYAEVLSVAQDKARRPFDPVELHHILGDLAKDPTWDHVIRLAPGRFGGPGELEYKRAGKWSKLTEELIREFLVRNRAKIEHQLS